MSRFRIGHKNTKFELLSMNQREKAAARQQKLEKFSIRTPFEVRNDPRFLPLSMIALFLPAALFSWINLDSWHHPSYGLIIGAGCFVLGMAGFWILATSRTLRVDENSLEIFSKLRRARWNWTEVTLLKIDDLGHFLSIETANRTIVFVGPAGWGKAGGNMMFLLVTLCQEHDIPFEGAPVFAD
jgi:hypothetical protein